MNHRHQLILETINNKRKVSVNELAELTGVSVVTIRNDLSLLEQQSYVKRSHGFAELLDRDAMSDRMELNYSLKLRLAKFASSLVEDGDAIFIEGGSTNSLLARELLSFKGELVVITVCTYIASLLKDAPFDVILLGGLLQTKSESVVGSLTRSCIGLTHFNKAFLGIDGYSEETGFTGRDMLRADVINCVLQKGANNIVIADSSKFGQVYSYPLQSEHVDHIITDSALNQQMQQALLKQQIRIDKVSE